METSRSLIPKETSPQGVSVTTALYCSRQSFFVLGWYGLSDGEIKEQVNDCLSFSRFVGLGMEDSAPDSITVCRFRNILVETDLYDRVLDEISRPLENRGGVVKRRAIVDVSN